MLADTMLAVLDSKGLGTGTMPDRLSRRVYRSTAMLHFRTCSGLFEYSFCGNILYPVKKRRKTGRR